MHRGPTAASLRSDPMRTTSGHQLLLHGPHPRHGRRRPGHPRGGRPRRHPRRLGAGIEPAPGTSAYRLKLPRATRLKAGTYTLKVSFTPAGQAKAVTRTVTIKLVGGKHTA